MIIVFAGSIGRFPIGGHAWVNLQYLAGLSELGHEVVYLEECGEQCWSHDWERDRGTTDLDYPAAYIRRCLELIGLQERWILRAGEGSRGMPLADFLDLCARADLLIVRAVPLGCWREEYGWPRRRAFIDVDPGFTQFSLGNGEPRVAETVERCERLFTIAQRIGRPDCPIPTVGRRWLRTVSPVWLRGWPAAGTEASCFSTIMQWRSYRQGHPYRKAIHDGVRYGQKGDTFGAYLDVPRTTAQRFRVALTGGDPDVLAAHGWSVVQGWAATRTPQAYRSFIGSSRAEFGIAKHGYVATRGGWFSDRSVCYLASGRPVLVADTGLGDWLPVGQGVLTFSNPQEALRGIASINADYSRHRQAARRLAEEVFDTARVLPALLAAAAD